MGVYYNGDGDLEYFRESSNIVTCPKCNKKYKQFTEDQVPGFRDKSEDICPYCRNVNGTSMDVEYSNYKLD